METSVNSGEPIGDSCVDDPVAEGELEESLLALSRLFDPLDQTLDESELQLDGEHLIRFTPSE